VHFDIIKVFYSPTDVQMNCLKNNFKIYIKIDTKTAPTCFGAVTPSSGSALVFRCTRWCSLNPDFNTLQPDQSQHAPPPAPRDLLSPSSILPAPSSYCAIIPATKSPGAIYDYVITVTLGLSVRFY